MTSSHPASFLGKVVSFVFFAAAAFLLYLGVGTIMWVYKAQTWVQVPAKKTRLSEISCGNDIEDARVPSCILAADCVH